MASATTVTGSLGGLVLRVNKNEKGLLYLNVSMNHGISEGKEKKKMKSNYSKIVPSLVS